jgi:hypothetical protein
MGLICSSCGRKVETIPLECGMSITMNSETNQMECDMGRCGVITLDNFLCENCCINKSILKIYYNYENLSLENQEFYDELKELKQNIVQTRLSNPDFTYWVEFGNGIFKCGKGENKKANINITSTQEVMSRILTDNSTVFSEFLSGNIRIEGDLQYVVVYFDLLGLAADISNEEVIIYNE